MQLTHYNSNFEQHSFPITLICDNVSNAANIGSLFRTADAFGIEKIIFCGNPVPFGRKVAQTSRSTEKYVNYEWHDNPENILQKFRSLGYLILALEITDNSTSLIHMELNTKQPIALLIGDENFGVSETLLKLADHIFHIEMFGQNSSMNVVQATNIALYEITKQLRKNK
ncbi:TrmH family RNA methyltransferase [Gelidibacter maritimus]|uniref:TrmH family RNA methyltransferase n=1 Tax=Gelidibacter maritimus TaxID=2761487 RepID=A0A7W2M7K7_9FLAO|nr:TrmH family RNA methyltransferase [Gelidibacter maritimus]MBA6154194.1 TrmH family RNA methyltransferase [Gelidibacter maritimus]